MPAAASRPEQMLTRAGCPAVGKAAGGSAAAVLHASGGCSFLDEPTSGVGIPLGAAPF